ncbi:hypothetical protein [Actinoplanes sp. NPDC023714]|uniref:hypothetical protein n=1 Tax=Actinoplanes sp. NPDC023714 TaxID=3154322 RepID=UPI0033E6802C
MADLERVAPAFLPHRSETVRPVDWDLVQERLGIIFPADYREYTSHYPPLLIDDFLVILGPAPGQEEGYLEATLERLDELRGLAEDDMTEDYTFHPEAGGLFPWGSSSEGDLFFWRTTGSDPDKWPTVVYTSNFDWWEHDGGALSLVVGLIDQSVPHAGLPPQPRPNPTVK